MSGFLTWCYSFWVAWGFAKNPEWITRAAQAYPSTAYHILTHEKYHERLNLEQIADIVDSYNSLTRADALQALDSLVSETPNQFISALNSLVALLKGAEQSLVEKFNILTYFKTHSAPPTPTMTDEVVPEDLDVPPTPTDEYSHKQSIIKETVEEEPTLQSFQEQEAPVATKPVEEEPIQQPVQVQETLVATKPAEEEPIQQPVQVQETLVATKPAEEEPVQKQDLAKDTKLEKPPLPPKPQVESKPKLQEQAPVEEIVVIETDEKHQLSSESISPRKHAKKPGLFNKRRAERNVKKASQNIEARVRKMLRDSALALKTFEYPESWDFFFTNQKNPAYRTTALFAVFKAKLFENKLTSSEFNGLMSDLTKQVMEISNQPTLIELLDAIADCENKMRHQLSALGKQLNATGTGHKLKSLFRDSSQRTLKLTEDKRQKELQLTQLSVFAEQCIKAHVKNLKAIDVQSREQFFNALRKLDFISKSKTYADTEDLHRVFSLIGELSKKDQLNDNAIALFALYHESLANWLITNVLKVPDDSAAIAFILSEYASRLNVSFIQHIHEEGGFNNNFKYQNADTLLVTIAELCDDPTAEQFIKQSSLQGILNLQRKSTRSSHELATQESESLKQQVAELQQQLSQEQKQREAASANQSVTGQVMPPSAPLMPAPPLNVPPPPPLSSAPPPPPLPVMSTASTKLKIVKKSTDGKQPASTTPAPKGDLMAELKGGVKLKKVTVDQDKPKVVVASNPLMAELAAKQKARAQSQTVQAHNQDIEQGVNQHKKQETVIERYEKEGGLVGALAAAMKSRRPAMEDDFSDEEEYSSSNEDDWRP